MSFKTLLNTILDKQEKENMCQSVKNKFLSKKIRAENKKKLTDCFFINKNLCHYTQKKQI